MKTQMTPNPIKTSTTATVTVIFIVFVSLLSTATSIPQEELDAALALLRVRGHSLLSNAISTSDLLFDFLSVDSLTILAPPDPSLFALDMTQSPPFYLSTLRIHALPRRLSHSDLCSLPNASFLPTLLPSRRLLLLTKTGDSDDVILFDGVRVVLPGLFYGGHVVVHGLGGLLLRTTNIGTAAPPGCSPPAPPNGTVIFPVPLPTNRTNRTFSFPPVPKIPLNHTIASPYGSSPPAPPNRTIIFPVPLQTNRTNRTFSFPLVPKIPLNHTIATRHLPKIATIPTPTDREDRTNSSPVPKVNCTFSPPPVPLRTVLPPAPEPSGSKGALEISPEISPASPKGSPEISPASVKEAPEISPASVKEWPEISPASPKGSPEISPASVKESPEISPVSVKESPEISTVSVKESPEISRACPRSARFPWPNLASIWQRKGKVCFTPIGKLVKVKSELLGEQTGEFRVTSVNI